MHEVVRRWSKIPLSLANYGKASHFALLSLSSSFFSPHHMCDVKIASTSFSTVFFKSRNSLERDWPQVKYKWQGEDMAPCFPCPQPPYDSPLLTPLFTITTLLWHVWLSFLTLSQSVKHWCSIGLGVLKMLREERAHEGGKLYEPNVFSDVRWSRGRLTLCSLSWRDHEMHCCVVNWFLQGLEHKILSFLGLSSFPVQVCFPCLWGLENHIEPIPRIPVFSKKSWVRLSKEGAAIKTQSHSTRETDRKQNKTLSPVKTLPLLFDLHANLLKTRGP